MEKKLTVDESLALVVVADRPSGVGSPLENDSIVLGSRSVAPGEGGVTEKTAGKVDGVDVERVGTALAEGVLHGSLGRGALVDVVEPVRVDRGLGAGKVERNAGARVALVEHRDLAVDLARGEAAVGAVGDHVVVDGDARGGESEVARAPGGTSRAGGGNARRESLLDVGGGHLGATTGARGRSGKDGRRHHEGGAKDNGEALELHLVRG